MHKSKAEIIRSVLHLVRLHGWEKLSVRMIANEIGYSTIKIYSDFGSKEKLLLEIQKHGFNKLKIKYQEAVSRSQNPQEALENMALAYIDFSKREPVYYELLFSFKFSQCESEALAVNRQIRDIILDVIEQTGTTEPMLALHQFCAMLYGYVKISEEMSNTKETFIEDSIRHFVKIFVKGIK